MKRISFRGGALLAAWLGTTMIAATVHAQGRPPAPPAKPCNPGNCVIKVKVADCQAPGGITIDPENVAVNSARNMRWEIEPRNSGFVFATSGIQFDPAHAQFQPRNSPRPDEVHIFNAKTERGEFYYFVNVNRVDGSACRQVDPFVRNN